MGNSLVVQWLGLLTFTPKCLGSIPGQGSKIPQGAGPSQNHNNEGATQCSRPEERAP